MNYELPDVRTAAPDPLPEPLVSVAVCLEHGHAWEGESERSLCNTPGCGSVVLVESVPLSDLERYLEVSR